MREEATPATPRFYQCPFTLRLPVIATKGDFDAYGKEGGQEISDDALFTVGLQNYHTSKTSRELFNISTATFTSSRSPAR